jgi:hypothetical protein
MITQEDVYTEDELMADVILNRQAARGGSIQSIVQAPNHFLGLGNGLALMQRAWGSAVGSSLCNDFTTALYATISEMDGPRLNTAILAWRGVINPKTNRARRQGSAIRVADTDFF